MDDKSSGSSPVPHHDPGRENVFPSPQPHRGLARGRLDRRRFVVGTGAAIGAMLVASRADATASTSPDAQVLPGVIERIDTPGALYLRGLGGSVNIPIIEFDQAAQFWRGGQHVALSSFVPGDEVVAIGRPSGDAFRASYMATMYRQIQGQVLERNQDRIKTTGGVVDIGQYTLAWSGPGLTAAPIESLAVGDQIIALCRRDPETGGLLAAEIGVLKAN